MTWPMILAPMFTLVLMTFVLLFVLAPMRAGPLRRGEVRAEDVSLRQPNWPTQSLQIGYAFQNQFELPFLFYVLTVLALITKHADFLFVVMAWIFVVTRIFHALVHCTSNDLRWRGPLFGVGALVLAIMWLIFIVRIMLVLP